MDPVKGQISQEACWRVCQPGTWHLSLVLAVPGLPSSSWGGRIGHPSWDSWPGAETAAVLLSSSSPGVSPWQPPTQLIPGPCLEGEVGAGRTVSSQ